MDIHLLGSTGYHPNQRRHTFCLMMPEIGVVVDAGTALFRARPLIETDSLDILLTHAHLDHVVGLTFLYDVLYGRSLDRVTVHGQLDKLQAIEQHLFAELIFPVAPPFQSQPLAEPLALGGAVVTWFPLSHPGGSVGYRFDWEQASLAIVTDTTAAADAEYIEHIRGVDLLIHECYFGDEYAEFAAKTGHSHTTPVAQLAAAAAVKSLVLVHVNPLDESDDPVGIETARRIFPNTTLGEDEMVLRLPIST